MGGDNLSIDPSGVDVEDDTLTLNTGVGELEDVIVGLRFSTYAGLTKRGDWPEDFNRFHIVSDDSLSQ